MGIDQEIAQLEQEISRAEQTNSQMKSNPYSSSVFGNQNKQNLVEWELDFKDELVEIERLLRCDILVSDEKGEHWVPNPNKEEVFLNNSGVSDILRKLRLLVNKNKVLSNYTIDEINKRVKILGHELRTLIYNNYEMYGIDNEYKMHNYPIVVLSIMCIIEDTYRRALGGETHKALAEQRLVTQTEPLNAGYPQMQMPQQKKGIVSRSMPWNWGK